MSVNEFDRKFGIKSSIQEEKSKFINRIENSLFRALVSHFEYDQYENLFLSVCYELGLDSTYIIKQNNFLNRNIPNFSFITEKDFIKTLRVIVAIYKCINEPNKLLITSYVYEALELTNQDIGVKWNEGIFYPTGDDLLDKELIDVSITLLNKYPNEKKDLTNALENYQAKSLYGVIENCFICLEGVGRKILGNKKTLDNNKENLLRLLKFSKYWDKLFLHYLNFAHEFRRHAGEKRHELKHEEVEAFLYLTCLIIRSIIRAYEEKA